MEEKKQSIWPAKARLIDFGWSKYFNFPLKITHSLDSGAKIK